MSAKNTRQYQEKSQRGWWSSKDFTSSVRYQRRKAGVKVLQHCSIGGRFGLATIVTTYKTQSMKMRKHVVFDRV